MTNNQKKERCPTKRKYNEAVRQAFTRSRAYKKNDQAHVEEKNGSIIRRLIGYDRYEGLEAYNALSALYAILRLYVNFFQPSLKLISKKRDGAKVTKKYDKAKTPYQRLLTSEHISEQAKNNLKELYNTLDPVQLLKDLERLQDNFWKFAWQENTKNLPTLVKQNSEQINNINSAHEFAINSNTPIAKEIFSPVNQNTIISQIENHSVNCERTTHEINNISIKRYRRTDKPAKHTGPRTWRTRTDPFENVWNELCLQLTLQPEYTAKSLLDDLIKKDPDQFNTKLLRTLQRRVAQWRIQQIKMHQEQHYENVTISNNHPVTKYVSLVAHTIIQR